MLPQATQPVLLLQMKLQQRVRQAQARRLQLSVMPNLLRPLPVRLPVRLIVQPRVQVSPLRMHRLLLQLLPVPQPLLGHQLRALLLTVLLTQPKRL